MLPMTAVPSAPPTSRDRSFSAEPTPCCARGSASVMAVVAGVMAAPMPMPSGTRPASISQYGVPVPMREMIASPAAHRTSPATHTAREPNRFTSRGVTRAAGIIEPESGSTASAATSGV